MDNTDESVVKILSNCRDAVSPGGKVIVVERPLSEPVDALVDLHMFALHGGGLRTEERHRELQAAAGLRTVRVIPTESQFSLFESVPA
jgi:hypothetical protein